WFTEFNGNKIGEIFIQTPCVAQGTWIMMADHSLQLIETLRRGDWVLGSDSQTKYQVSRVTRYSLHAAQRIDLLELSPHAIQMNQPFERLLITPDHPVIYQDCRRPAKCFQNFPGVEFHHSCLAQDRLLTDL